MSTCKRCGKRVPKGADTCPSCGAPVTRRRRWPIVVLVLSLVAIVGCGVVCALWATGVIGGSPGSPLGPAGGGGSPVEEASDDGGSDDPFVLLQPGFTSEKVTSEAGARSVIAGVASKLGIDDVETELVDCQEGEAFDNRYWRFSQSYEGIPVYGRDVVVSADEDGEVLFLTSNFDDMEGVPTEPTVSAEDAEAAAGDEAGTDAVVPISLVVYSLGAADPELAWQYIVVVDGRASWTFVSAESGSVIATDQLDLEETARCTGTDATTGDTVSFRGMRQDDDTYRMRDEEGNLETRDAQGATVTTTFVYRGNDGNLIEISSVDDASGSSHFEDDQGQIVGFNYTDQSGVWDIVLRDNDQVVYDDVSWYGFAFYGQSDSFTGTIEPIISTTSEFDDERATAAMVRGEDILDFYENQFGRTGFDGRGGQVELIMDDGGFRSNAITTWGGMLGGIMIRFSSDITITDDLIGHEYTHGLENSVSGLSGNGESGALKEATSDIIGEAFEEYRTGSCDWIHGIRNLVDPSRSTASERGSGQPAAHPTRYEDADWGDPTSSTDSGFVHNNSTVVSHAAYLMCNDTDEELAGEALDTEQMARHVYATFISLTPDSTFSQYRNCMELTAGIMIDEGYLSSENLTRISAAFDEVNIGRADNNDYMKDNSEGEVKEAVTTIKGSRDVALVLDCSGSMDGEPIESMRTAASEFVSRAASPNVRVGLVAYSSTSTTLSPLSSNLGSLGTSISELTSGGDTNMDAGIQDGMQLLGSASGDRRRIVVLMSDGLPNTGRTDEELVSYVDGLKEDGVKVYTLSFGDDEGGRALLAQLASQGCNFNANNTDELEGFFNDIAEEISGTAFIRAEVACPVDVTVTLNGETLSSRPESLCTRTSFGTLTLEEDPEGDGTTTKVLRLREGEPYDIQIEGTGVGTMDYTIGFMDEYGDYTDSRTFSQIGVTGSTRMETTAVRADETTLRVDEDGDGVTDTVWRATAGGTASRVDNSGVAWATTVGCVVVAGGLAALRVRSLVRRRRELRAAA